jgi:hypothetical protein
MTEDTDQWQRLITQQLFRLEANQIALKGIVAFLGEKVGLSPAGLLKMIQMSERAVYQRRLERLEGLSPEVAVHLDTRADGEEPVLADDFGLDDSFMKRLNDLLHGEEE